MSRQIYLAGGAPYTTGGAAIYRLREHLGSGCLSCSAEHAMEEEAPATHEHREQTVQGSAQGMARFIFAGRRRMLALEGPGRMFGGDRLLEKLAQAYDIDLRRPDNPYGKVVFLVNPVSREIVDVDRDECDDDVEYEVDVEPKLEGGWNLMPVLERLFTFDYASSAPLPRRNEISSVERTRSKAQQ